MHETCHVKKILAPLKGNRTIPKLELAGTITGALQAMFIKKAWDIPKGVKYFLWMDAKVVLEWLGQYNIKQPYVNNRVADIRELFKYEEVEIRYVPSELNPADVMTKPQDVDKCMENKMWFQGP